MGYQILRGSLPTYIGTKHAHDRTSASVTDNSSGMLQTTAVAADEIAEKEYAACPLANVSPLKLSL